MNGITHKLTAFVMAIAVVSALVVGGAVVSPDHDVDDVSPVGEAEAVAPIVAGGVIVGASMIFSGGYLTSEYFDGSEDVEQATDETLREAVHDDAIVSQGTNEGFLDNVDNDINTIEGSLEQKLGQAFIAEGDSVNSETEAVTLSENTASDYLWTTQQNLIETHNYHALSVHTHMEKLDSVDSGDDVGTLKYASGDSTFTTSGTDQVIKLESDISGGSLDPMLATSGDAIIDLNGHELTITGGNNVGARTLITDTNGNNYTFKNGTINLEGETNLHYVKSTGTQINMVGVTLNVGSSASYGYSSTSNEDFDLYTDEDTNFSASDVSYANAIDQPASLEMSGSGNVTMDPADLSSDVPTVTVGESDKELTAVKVNVDPSYAQSDDNTVKVAVPYDTSDGSALTDKNVIIATSTSGVQNYAVPVDFARAHDLVTQRDQLSAETYSISSQWAKDIWNNGLSSVAADDSKSVTDMEGVYDELGTYTVSGDPDNPATVLSLYTGTYETVVDPANTRMTVTDSNGTHENVVLFSTDMQYLADQTSDSTVLAEDDTFDVSTSTQSNSESFTSVAQGDTVQLANGKIDTITSATDASSNDVSSNVSIVDAEAGIIEYTGSSTIDLTVEYDYTEGPERTFAIDPSTGERVSLSGSVTVDSITVGDDSEVSSVDIRTFDTTETNLSNIADRLDSQYNVTIEVADNSGSGFSFGDLGTETGIIIIVAIGGAIVLLGRFPV